MHTAPTEARRSEQSQAQRAADIFKDAGFDYLSAKREQRERDDFVRRFGFRANASTPDEIATIFARNVENLKHDELGYPYLDFSNGCTNAIRIEKFVLGGTSLWLHKPCERRTCEPCNHARFVKLMARSRTAITCATENGHSCYFTTLTFDEKHAQDTLHKMWTEYQKPRLSRSRLNVEFRQLLDTISAETGITGTRLLQLARQRDWQLFFRAQLPFAKKAWRKIYKSCWKDGYRFDYEIVWEPHEGKRASGLGRKNSGRGNDRKGFAHAHMIMCDMRPPRQPLSLSTRVIERKLHTGFSKPSLIKNADDASAYTFKAAAYLAKGNGDYSTSQKFGTFADLDTTTGKWRANPQAWKEYANERLEGSRARAKDVKPQPAPNAVPADGTNSGTDEQVRGLAEGPTSQQLPTTMAGQSTDCRSPDIRPASDGGADSQSVPNDQAGVRRRSASRDIYRTSLWSVRRRYSPEGLGKNQSANADREHAGGTEP